MSHKHYRSHYKQQQENLCKTVSLTSFQKTNAICLHLLRVCPSVLPSVFALLAFILIFQPICWQFPLFEFWWISRHSSLNNWVDSKVAIINSSIACEQALLFGRVKRVSRERASERRSRKGPSLARSREAHFACLNRRACSQANSYISVRPLRHRAKRRDQKRKNKNQEQSVFSKFMHETMILK